ncbi:MAG: hypothetical protein K2I63_00735 [Helicobacter sp.]|nr:hypothetical protein [Helicobacter sp.]
MVKLILILCFCIGSVLANPKIDYEIISLLGVKDYKINQKFIQRLFQNENDFIDKEGEADLYKISQTLKQNGLLKIIFNAPMELQTTFNVAGNPLAFTSALYDILGAMGYYYFITQQSILKESSYHLTLLMNTEYAIDPVLLQEHLKNYGYKILKIKKGDTNKWDYEVQEKTIKYPRATFLEPFQKQEKANLSGEYWYQISEGNILSVTSNNASPWYPKIVFFNEKLQILDIFTQATEVRKIRVKIPKSTTFIKISDSYLPIITKNGLTVELQ